MALLFLGSLRSVVIPMVAIPLGGAMPAATSQMPRNREAIFVPFSTASILDSRTRVRKIAKH
jgi:hypothetical protein